MSNWDFEAPQFVDFANLEDYEHEYSDSWFDKHTEADELLILKRKRRPNRQHENQEAKTEGASRNSPRTVRQSSQIQPQNSANGHAVADTSSPATNTRLQTRSSKDHSEARVMANGGNETQSSSQEISPETRSISAKRKLEAVGPLTGSSEKIESPRKITKYLTNSSSNISEANPNLEMSVAVKRSQSLRCRVRLPGNKVQLPSHDTATETESKSSMKATTAIESLTVSSEKAESSKKMAMCVTNSNSNIAGARRTPAASVAVKRSQSLRCRTQPDAEKTLLQPNKSEYEQKASESDMGTGTITRLKTSEQLELEKIAAMKRELAKTRKLAQDSYKKSMSTQGYMPVRSALPATVPVSFQFKTDERTKNPEVQTQDRKIKFFPKSLREALPHAALPAKPQVYGLTQPQPFKLSSTKSASSSSLAQTSKYESVAEKVAAFHRKTPDRFKSQPHGSRERASSADKSEIAIARRLRSQSPKLTVAKTPTLATRGRSRPVHALSREVTEQMEIEENQKQQFKAHPVNPKVFDAPALPKAQTKPVTVVEEFKLHSQKSSEDLIATDMEVEEKYEFHARPVNPKILAGPVGIQPVERKPLTIPESPAFALKNRVRVPEELPKEEPKEPVKTTTVPYTGIPFVPRLAHHSTVPKPFTVEERSREMLTRRELKIQKLLEEERKAHEFYAQDLPSDSPDELPPKQVKPLTQPEPFRLAIDDRGERYQKEFKSKLEEEDRAAREIANFKARPNDVIHKGPFLPLKSCKPLTESSSFPLNTDVRATQREAFDQHLKAREAELEALKKQRTERIEKEERSAVARMRMKAVHKASTIKRYKSVSVKPSDKPLTEPQSPKFSQRGQSKHVSDT